MDFSSLSTIAVILFGWTIDYGVSLYCTFDHDCDSSNPLCIFNECYPYKDFSETCVYDRQCYLEGQFCKYSWVYSTCQCYNGWKRIRDRCLAPDVCEFTSDCDNHRICRRNRCLAPDVCEFPSDCDNHKICRRGHCIVPGLSGWQIGVIVFAGLMGIVLTMAFLRCMKLKRQRQENALLIARRSRISPPMPPTTIYTQSYGQPHGYGASSSAAPGYDPPPSYSASQEGKY